MGWQLGLELCPFTGFLMALVLILVLVLALMILVLVLMDLIVLVLMVRGPMGRQSELEPCMLSPLPLLGRQATTRGESGSKDDKYIDRVSIICTFGDTIISSLSP